MTHTIHLSPDLIRLERGQRLLLVDGQAVRPLAVTQGKEKVAWLLDLCAARPQRSAILDRMNDPPLLDALIDHGILRETPPEEGPSPCPVPAARAAGTTPRRTISLYLLLTQYCNLRCVYCLNGETTYARSRRLKMSPAVAFKAVEVHLATLPPDGELEIVFFGGEPLLNWPLAKAVIRHVESNLKPSWPDRRIRYHCTTNLTVFPPDLIDWAKRYDMTFLVDVDGTSDIHNAQRPGRSIDSYARTAANIARLARAGIAPALRTTVTGANVERIPEISRLHRDLGGGSSAFVPLNPVNSDELILPESLYPAPARLADGLSRLFEAGIWEDRLLYPLNEFAGRIHPGARSPLACGAPFGCTPVVDCTGEIFACIYLVGIERYRLGNVFDPAYPRQDVLLGLREVLHVDADSVCSACAYRYLCGGGCPVGKLTVAANPASSQRATAYAREVPCAMAKTSINHALWRLVDAIRAFGNAAGGANACRPT